jgi:hypothetical protein
LIAATLYGLGILLVIGVEGLTGRNWVDPVFWGLIGAGVALDYRHRFTSWFTRQSSLVQNAVATVGFLAVAGGVTLLLRESTWTWHIAG